MEYLTTDRLRSIKGLCFFPREQLNLMVRLGRHRTCRKGTVLSYQKETCHSCFLIIEGAVEQRLYLTDEKTMRIGTARQGDWLHIPELYLNTPTSYDSVLCAAGEVLEYGPGELQELLEHNEFRKRVLSLLSKEIIDLYRNRENNTPRSRLLSLLRENAVIDGKGNARIPMTQDAMAADTGTARETVNRSLKDLEKKGILRTGRGEIHILDLPGLDAAE